MLYLRMFITLAISLFTTRIVFNALGLSDLGIYNVVGGVLSLLGILNNTMSGAAQRFISFDLGCNNKAELNKTFTTLLTAQIFLCLFLVIIAETIGLWFVNTKLVIPADKKLAANCIFQTSVISLVLTVVKSSFTAAIIAHEKMSIYAYFSIIDVVIKLLIVVALLYIPDNKLIIYALLLLLSTVIDFAITIIYSLKKFAECSLKLKYDKARFKEIFSFSGWTLIGQTTIIANEQVLNIFINWFFGPIANGARDIAGRVNNMVAQFVFQFQTAINPPIVKSYASGDYTALRSLLVLGCKVSYLLMFIISIPIIVETPLIFKIWLGSTPEYTVWFLRFILINTLVDSMTGPISKCIQATGRVKKMQIWVSSILLCVIPLSYLLLKIGWQPYSVYYVTIIFGLITLLVRIRLLSDLIPMSSKEFIIKTFIPCLLSSLIVLIIMFSVKHLEKKDNIIIGFTNCIVSIIISIVCFYLIVLHKQEKVKINNIILSKFKR